MKETKMTKMLQIMYANTTISNGIILIEDGIDSIEEGFLTESEAKELDEALQKICDVANLITDKIIIKRVELELLTETETTDNIITTETTEK